MIFWKMDGKRKKITWEVISKDWKYLSGGDAVAKHPRMYKLEKGKMYETTA